MTPLPIQLISTDFDGTLHADFEHPPVPLALQTIIADLQQQGAKWVINTGRDLSSLMETMGRGHLSIKPDYIIVVEREIYAHEKSQYLSLTEWNDACTAAHAELFSYVRKDLQKIVSWVNQNFAATVYEDIYSPFCLIAENNEDTDRIQEYLETYCRTVPHLTVVRNDVYARFSHAAYNKGTALAELARRLKIAPANILAAGDHFNDLPMLDRRFAHHLVAPVNAIPVVKETVLRQNGFVATQPCGLGVAQGLAHFLKMGK